MQKWRQMLPNLIAYALTPAVLFGGLGVVVGRTTDFAETLFTKRHDASEKRTEEVRVLLQERITEPPTTAVEVEKQISEISTLAKIIWVSGEPHDMLISWRTELEALLKNLQTREAAKAEQERQLALAAEAERQKNLVLAQRARGEAAKRGRDIVIANEAAKDATNRITGLKLPKLRIKF